MEKSEKMLKKVLDTLSHMSDEKEKIDYILYYLNRLLKAEKTLFLNKRQIPKRGLTKKAWQDREGFFVNYLTEDVRYDKTSDNYGEEIHSLLFYPVVHQGSNIGLLVSVGKNSYTVIEDKMTPLKSGEQTIGVTVKQVSVEIPAHEFTSSDLSLLNELLPILIKAVYPDSEEKRENINETISEEEEMEEYEKESILKSTVNKMKQFFGNKL